MTTEEFYQVAYKFFEPVVPEASKAISAFFSQPLDADVARVDFVVYQNLHYAGFLTIQVWPTTIDNEVYTTSPINVPIGDLSNSSVTAREDWSMVEKAIPVRFLEAWRKANLPVSVPCFFGFHDAGEYLNLENGVWLEEKEYYELIDSRSKNRNV